MDVLEAQGPGARMDPVQLVAAEMGIPKDIQDVWVHRQTLSFKGKDGSEVPELERTFTEETARRFRTLLRWSTLAFVIAQLLFLPYDFVRFYDAGEKERFWLVLALRFGLYAPTAAAIAAVTYHTNVYVNKSQYLGVAASILGGGIIAFSLLGQDPGSGTLALFIVYTSSFTPLVARNALAVEALLLAAFIPLRIGLFPEDSAAAKVEDIGILLLFYGTINYISHKREFFLRRNHVQERTLVLQQLLLEREQERNTQLLCSMLPEQIIEGLKAGDAKLADEYRAVTVLFCEICDFASISAKIPPSAAIALLSRVFQVFDQLVQRHGVHKVETVGEVYMCVAGAPDRCLNHAALAANMSLAIQEAMPAIRDALRKELRALGDAAFDVHIGLNSGPIVAGVVGIRNPRWKLFGDTVNTASRMESTCPRGRIQCSAATTHLLKGDYLLEERGPIPVKGKGLMVTHFLLSGREEPVPRTAPALSDRVPAVYVPPRYDDDGAASSSGASTAGESGPATARKGERTSHSRPLTRSQSKTSRAMAHWRQMRAQESPGGAATGVGGGSGFLGPAGGAAHGSFAPGSVLGLVDGSPQRRRESFVLPGGPAAPFEQGGKLHARLHEAMRGMSSRLALHSPGASPRRTPRGTPFGGAHAPPAPSPLGARAKGSPMPRRPSPQRLDTLDEGAAHEDAVSAGQLDVEEGGGTRGTAPHDGSANAARRERGPDLLGTLFESAIDRPAVLTSRCALLFPSWAPEGGGGFEAQFAEAYANRRLRMGRITVAVCVATLAAFGVWDAVRLDEGDARVERLALVRWAFIAPVVVLYLAVTFTARGRSHLGGATAVAVFLVGCGVIATSVVGEDPGYSVLALYVVYCYNLTAIQLGVRIALFGALIGGHLVSTKALVAAMPWARVWEQAAFLLVFYLGQALPVVWRELSMREDFFRRSVLESQWELLKEEEGRTEELLNNLLPASVAAKLKDGATMVADKFERVSVLFTDMKHFTSFSSKVTPGDVVDFLNAMYSDFDRISAHYGLYKVEIIGDAYYVVCGCPDPVPDHAKRLVHAAFDMLELMPKLREMTQSDIQIRIGIHTGPVVAGVVGRLDPRYHLFGSTVVEANKMESHGVENKVHVSAATHAEIAGDADFELEERGEIEVSGLGPRTTFFATRRVANSLGAYHREDALIGVATPAPPDEGKA